MTKTSSLLLTVALALCADIPDVSAGPRPPCFCYFSKQTDFQTKRCRELGFTGKLELTFTVSCRDDPSYPFAIEGTWSDQQGFFSSPVTIRADSDGLIQIDKAGMSSVLYGFQITAWDARDSREMKANPTGAAKGAIWGGLLFGLPGALIGADIGGSGTPNDRLSTLLLIKDLDGTSKSYLFNTTRDDVASSLRGFLESTTGLLPGQMQGDELLGRRLRDRLSELESSYAGMITKNPSRPWCNQLSADPKARTGADRIQSEIGALRRFASSQRIQLATSKPMDSTDWDSYLEANPSMKTWAKANPRQADALKRCQ